MLLNLHVKNLALIDEVDLCLEDNLNILTGETGAGKSIIIGSINLALGGKVPKDLIRNGAEYALIELVFEIEQEETLEQLRQLDIVMEDGQLVISRKIMENRNLCKLNGETVTITTLKQVASLLLDMHGQHEHQSLLYKQNHLTILDRFAKEEIGTRKEQLKESYQAYRKVRKEIEEASLDEDKRQREISFLEYEKQEIEEADLKDGEEEELGTQFRRMNNAETILTAIKGAYKETGYGDSAGAGECIGRAIHALNRANELDTTISEFLQQLLEVESLLNDFNRNLSDYQEEFEFDEVLLAQTENRLNVIHGIQAKYGTTVDEVRNYYEEVIQKLEKYQNYEVYMERLKAELDKRTAQMEHLCEEVSQIRRKQGKKLAEKIREALADLNFLDVRFEIEFEKRLEYSENGYDGAEFMISTNPGESLAPLSKVVSGGELSRIMLAIKTVLADNDEIPTLVFDEIDTGISGRTAQKVSEKLSVIAKKHQVICITHLPQIAAMADVNFVIEKSVRDGKTVTQIQKLSEKKVIDELARMLGGTEITEKVRMSATEMKELANQIKKK